MLLAHWKKVGSTLAELCVCQTRRAHRNYDHSLEITAMGEARDVTITAEQSTAAAGPALGVFHPVLGFFPALSFYLPDWKLSPLYFGFRGRAECVCSMTRLELNLSTKEFLPSCCQTMPASGPGPVGEASCHSCSHHQLQGKPVCLKPSVNQHQHFLDTSSLMKLDPDQAGL
jgi:hypothetical protein